MRKMGLWATYAVALAGLVACNDDDNSGWLDNSPRIVFKNVCAEKSLVESGAIGAMAVGESTTFSFAAAPGQALAFALQPNAMQGLFLAPENPGLPLYDAEGEPLTGVVEGNLQLWSDSEAGVTPNEAEEGATASELLQVELAYDATSSVFTCTLTNTSGESTTPTPLSAGAYAISNVMKGALMDTSPIFEAGEEADEALLALAEEGSNTALLAELAEETGIITTLHGAIVVVYTGEQNPLYALDSPDAGLGLATLAETGDPRPLEIALSQLAHVKRIYISERPVLPGEQIECLYWATKHEKVAYAVGFGYANDWFFANDTTLKGREAGNTTSKSLLLDCGTAVSQYPGAGAAQSLFDGTPIPESEPITEVGDEFPVPSLDKLIQIEMYTGN